MTEVLVADVGPDAGPDVFETVLRAGRPVRVVHGCGAVQHHDVPRWLADADPVDRRVLARCTGPIVDLGCGPGRLVARLVADGIPALGVDVSPVAVGMTRARGAAALRGDVLGPLPGEGLWSHALLMDGNIGIGGDPVRLLRRVRRLLAPGGAAVVEASPHDVDRRGPVRLQAHGCGPDPGGAVAGPFPWAEVGVTALLALAAATRWCSAEHWADGGRRFVRLTAPGRRPRSRPSRG
ncbi:methyltransferase domain-containing protein [Kineosporia sp. R_H_3]|uniref:methyltransferase domain-containing protein n=1 Tax=Kineosporia sp. R_H_3 TaxID=1961848 RepID=UPI000B4BF298|nr:class I SAM-dependent methyltransferase [Kineosporia sp. R_H_3]